MYAWVNKPRPVWAHALAAGVLVALGIAIGRKR